MCTIIQDTDFGVSRYTSLHQNHTVIIGEKYKQELDHDSWTKMCYTSCIENMQSHCPSHLRGGSYGALVSQATGYHCQHCNGIQVNSRPEDPPLIVFKTKFRNHPSPQQYPDDKNLAYWIVGLNHSLSFPPEKKKKRKQQASADIRYQLGLDNTSTTPVAYFLSNTQQAMIS